MVLWLKDCLTEKKITQETARCVSKNRNCFNLCIFGDRTLAYSGAKVRSRFYPGDLVTRTGHREIRSVYPGDSGLSGRVGIYAITRGHGFKSRLRRGFFRLLYAFA